MSRVESPGLEVDLGAGELEPTHGVNDLAGHALGTRVADGEVMQRALGLSAPVAVCGDVDGTHRVALGAHLGAGCGRGLGHGWTLLRGSLARPVEPG